MKKLKRLVSCLSNREVELVKRFYANDTTSNLKARLFDYLMSDKSPTNKEAAKVIYDSKPDARFSMLKLRLRKDLLNVLLLEEGGKKYATTLFSKRFDVRQIIIDSEILFARGLVDVGTDMLKSALKVAKDFELLEEQMLIHNLLQRYLGIKDYQLYDHHFAEKTKVYQELGIKYEAQEKFDKITIPALLTASDQNSAKDSAKEMLLELQVLKEKSDSKEVYSLYLRALTYFNHLEQDYENALAAAIEFRDLVLKEKSLHSKSRLTGSNMQIAIIQIFVRQFDQAAHHANLALSDFVKNSRNSLSAMSLLFRSYFYNRQYTEAGKTIEQALRSPVCRQDSYLKSIWLYKESCFLFVNAQYERALRSLMKANEILSDRSGWRFGVKILEIMTLIELGKLDLVYYRLESFYKLLRSTKTSQKSRPFLIYRSLKDVSKRLNSLEDVPEDLRFDEELWDPLGYEIVRYHNWAGKSLEISNEI